MGTKICIMSEEGRWCRCHKWLGPFDRVELPRDMMNMYPSQSSTSTYIHQPEGHGFCNSTKGSFFSLCRSSVLEECVNQPP